MSLLRVMTLRDADAIVLEPGRIPQLRRRGNVEALAMPALDPQLLADFARPLLDGQSLSSGPVMVTFRHEDATYPVTVEETASGLRIVVRKPSLKKPEKKELPPRSQGAESPPPEPISSRPSLGDLSASRRLGGNSGSLAALLGDAVRVAAGRGASDLFVSTGRGASIKRDGRLEAIDVAVDDEQLAACVGELARGGSVDLSMECGGVRLRVNAFVHMGGCAVAARLIKESVPGLGELGLPDEIASLVELRDGLVVVCGPTGSGKSTTLAALVDLLDQRRAAHVITLEDPIEYRFAARQSLIHQRELGTHVASFADGLRAALREAPDVILLGELRDRETISAALTAAETGHLVLATLHAASAVGAIDRIVDAFPESQARQTRSQLAGCLRAIVTQYLLPKRNGGRALAVELVPVTAAVANIVRKGELQTLSTAIQSGRDAGMIPLERSLARLEGVVAPQVIRRVAADHDLLGSLTGRAAR
ncbi:MAG: PilT/PilU family type 4a pilus ATPase [Deltaproteobacteria bacterium]|nr:PilT/PilU family type 4a pilus ATPase [Deltaproteobacteria bacterium]